MRTPKLKLHTLLLSVFLFTIITSSLAIISFTYSKYSKSIHIFSEGTIERAGKFIVARINCLLNDFERLPMIGANRFKLHPEPSVKNEDLISFFLDEVKYCTHLLSYYLGMPSGGHFGVLNLSLSQFPEVENPPPHSKYLLLVSDGKAPEELGVFYDENLEGSETEMIPRSFDPRVRPWYIGAEKTRKLYWTDVYYFTNPAVDPGISVSLPVYGNQGQLICVIAADLSLNVLSQFLAELTISPHGQAFVQDAHGKIILPKNHTATSEALSNMCHTIFEKEKRSDFSFDFSGETYLASMHSFPPSFNNNWTIVVLAPRSDFFSNILAAQRLAIFFSLGVIVLASLLVVFLSHHISKPIVALSDEIDRIAKLDLESERRISSQVSEISRIDTSVASMRTALRSFAHYVPSEIAKQLMQKKNEIVLGGDKKTITTFFTDIADFTAISERLPIETVNALLADHFDALSQIILQCGGLIDKYLGDGIMSLWGAAEESPDQAANACKAALLCQVRLSELNAKQKEAGMPEFVTRMGITTGVVIVGNFGTAKRMNYSAIGDAVNTAFRLQTLNKIYGTKIIIGEATAKDLGDRFLVRPLGTGAVKGKKEKLKIFELVGAFEGDPSIAPTPAQIELCSAFAKAYHAFERGDLEEAKRLFLAIQDRFPNDQPTKLFLVHLK